MESKIAELIETETIIVVTRRWGVGVGEYGEMFEEYKLPGIS